MEIAIPNGVIPGSAGLAQAHPQTAHGHEKTAFRRTWSSYGPPYPFRRWSSSRLSKFVPAAWCWAFRSFWAMDCKCFNCWRAFVFCPAHQNAIVRHICQVPVIQEKTTTTTAYQQQHSGTVAACFCCCLFLRLVASCNKNGVVLRSAVWYGRMKLQSVPYHTIYESTGILHAQPAAAVAAAAACVLSNTTRRPREGLLYSAALLCGGRGSAPLELSLQHEVWSSPLTHPIQQPQPAGDNNSKSHLKMHRQVVKHGWLATATHWCTVLCFPRRSGPISILNNVAKARRRSLGFALTNNGQLPIRAKTLILHKLLHQNRAE